MNLTFSWTKPRKLLPCAICGTSTVHAQSESGEWVCGCATIHPGDIKSTWTIGEHELPSDPSGTNQQPNPSERKSNENPKPLYR